MAFQTGGTVDDRFAIAHTSERSFADQSIFHPFGEGDDPGMYGNWKPDPGERLGPLGVILAKDFGKGRIVMVADQNVFGNLFFDFADFVVSEYHGFFQT